MRHPCEKTLSISVEVAICSGGGKHDTSMLIPHLRKHTRDRQKIEGHMCKVRVFRI